MSRIVFLVEERSMKVLLDMFLPRVFPELPFLCVPHEGKRDLELSIPRKLRGWREPGVRFAVVRDNDGADCERTRQTLVELCLEAGRGDSLVRVVCQELEAWYLGDPQALATAFGDDKLLGIGSRSRFRDPDAVVQPARALGGLIPEFQKVSGARRMAIALDRERNTSKSFRVFLEGVERLAQSIRSVPPGGTI